MIRSLLVFFCLILPLRAESELKQAAKQLAAPSFRERNAASKTLFSAGPEAIPVLEELVKNPDPEVASRASELKLYITLDLTPETPKDLLELVNSIAQNRGDNIAASIIHLSQHSHPQALPTAIFFADRFASNHSLKHPAIKDLFLGLEKSILEHKDTEQLITHFSSIHGMAYAFCFWHERLTDGVSFFLPLLKRKAFPEIITAIAELPDNETNSIAFIRSLTRNALITGEIDTAKTILKAATSSSIERFSHDLATLSKSPTLPQGKPPSLDFYLRRKQYFTITNLDNKIIYIHPETASSVKNTLRTFTNTPPQRLPEENTEHIPSWTQIEAAISQYDLKKTTSLAQSLDAADFAIDFFYSAAQFTEAAKTRENHDSLKVELAYLKNEHALGKKIDFSHAEHLAKDANISDLIPYCRYLVDQNQDDMALIHIQREIDEENMAITQASEAFIPGRRGARHYIYSIIFALNTEATPSVILKKAKHLLTGKSSIQEAKTVVRFAKMHSTSLPIARNEIILSITEQYHTQDPSLIDDAHELFLEQITHENPPLRSQNHRLSKLIGDQAKVYWQTLAKEQPNVPYIRHYLGQDTLSSQLPLSDSSQRLAYTRALIDTSAFEAAAEQLHTIISTSPLTEPSCVTAQRMLGDYYFDRKDYQKAAKYFELHAINSLRSSHSYSNTESFIKPASRLAISRGLLAIEAKNKSEALLWLQRLYTLNIREDSLAQSFIKHFPEDAQNIRNQRIQTLDRILKYSPSCKWAQSDLKNWRL